MQTQTQTYLSWISKLVISLDGNSYFEIVPIAGNRGNFVLHLIAGHREDDRHFPRYFWDKADAQKEVESYLLRQAIDAHGNPCIRTDRLPIKFGEPLEVIVGDDCIATVRSILIYDGHRCSVGNYAVTIDVHEEKKDLFVIDAPDLFPRLYFDRTIAITETWFWMRAKGQT